MAISTTHYTRLTNNLERDLVRLGGGNPNKAIPREELSRILAIAIDTMDEHNAVLLEKLCSRMVSHLSTDERKRLEEMTN